MKSKEELQEILDMKLLYHSVLVDDLKTVQEFIDDGNLKKAEKWLKDLE